MIYFFLLGEPQKDGCFDFLTPWNLEVAGYLAVPA